MTRRSSGLGRRSPRRSNVAGDPPEHETDAGERHERQPDEAAHQLARPEQGLEVGPAVLEHAKHEPAGRRTRTARPRGERRPRDVRRSELVDSARASDAAAAVGEVASTIAAPNAQAAAPACASRGERVVDRVGGAGEESQRSAGTIQATAW